MRLFFGIDLPIDAKEVIVQLTHSFSDSQARIKWVKKENLHITLRFLGEHDPQKILEYVGNSCPEKPFYISLKSIGAFPNLLKPRILWVGVETGEEKVKSIYKLLDERLSSLKLKKESNFFPHITFGRVRQGRFRMPPLDFEYPEFKIERFYLFSSVLKPGGPIYSKIAEIKLGGK